MLLSEIFDQLTFGELSQLYISGRDENGIQACDYEQIIPHINLGLIELYKRFDLKRNEVKVQLQSDINIYHLNSKFALSREGVSLDPQYIMDTVDIPFTDDILKIEEVYDKYGNKLTLNDKNNYFDTDNTGTTNTSIEYTSNNVPIVRTVLTPSYLSIQSTYSDTAALLTIRYRAKHKQLPTYNIDLSTEEVDLPYGLLEALCLFVGARAYTGMTGESAQDGNNFMQKFEMSCKRVEEYGLENITQTTNYKLIENGWA